MANHASLTEDEKVRTRHHTGYLNVDQVQTFALGIPAAYQTQFIIEGAMDRLLPEALSKFREILTILDTIEQQKVADLELLAITSLGSINIQRDEQKLLNQQYLEWRQALCSMLGIQPNPFDNRFGGMGINCHVIH